MIIGLSGYAQSGKDTVGRILVNHHGFRRLAFADPLKAILADMDPLIGEYVSDTDGEAFFWPICRLGIVAGPVGIAWEKAKRNPEVRRLLQTLGVAARRHLGDDVWVNALMRQIEDAPPDTDWVITDVRFPNEAEAIIDRDGVIVRVVRPGRRPVNEHQSETALDDWPFDTFIFNTGSINELAKTVTRCLAR